MKLPVLEPKFVSTTDAATHEVFHSFSRGICPTCRGLVDGVRLIRGGKVFSGPVALLLRLTNLIPLAAISFLFGALISRLGWALAGSISGCDPEAVLASQR